MVLKDFKAAPLLRRALQTRVNKVLEISTDTFREAVVKLTNPFVCFSVTASFKGRLAYDKLIGEDA